MSKHEYLTNFCFWFSINICKIQIIHSQDYISSNSDLFPTVWGVLNGFVDTVAGRAVGPDLTNDNKAKKRMALLVTENF